MTAAAWQPCLLAAWCSAPADQANGDGGEDAWGRRRGGDSEDNVGAAGGLPSAPRQIWSSMMAASAWPRRFALATQCGRDFVDRQRRLVATGSRRVAVAGGRNRRHPMVPAGARQDGSPGTPVFDGYRFRYAAVAGYENRVAAVCGGLDDLGRSGSPPLDPGSLWWFRRAGSWASLGNIGGHDDVHCDGEGSVGCHQCGVEGGKATAMRFGDPKVTRPTFRRLSSGCALKVAGGGCGKHGSSLTREDEMFQVKA
uniref:Uncharacterized protein n=1 Tax=Leersia perrieri TaxID=77586 RepID=A0A0D9XQP9_9ORYZ